MPGGKSNIKPSDGKQFSKDYQPNEKWTEKVAVDLANDLINWLKEKDEDGEDKGNMFFNEFLVIERDLDDSTIAYLKKKFSSFSELLKKAKKIQEIKLVKYGVGDRLNATMTKFVLTNNHDYSDKTDLTTKGESINNVPPITSEQIDKLIDKL
jgi:hypothetical protein